jgi:hypothetical protein
VQRLSDSTTRNYKLGQLALVSVAVGLVLLWQYFSSNPRYSIFMFLFVCIAMAAAVAFTMWRGVGYLADEVFEDGVALVARRNGSEVRVPFENISDVYAVNTSTREGIEVQLRTHVPPFGKRIVFWPPNWRSLSGDEMNVIAATLKSRIARGIAD